MSAPRMSTPVRFAFENHDVQRLLIPHIEPTPARALVWQTKASRRNQAFDHKCLGQRLGQSSLQ